MQAVKFVFSKILENLLRFVPTRNLNLVILGFQEENGIAVALLLKHNGLKTKVLVDANYLEAIKLRLPDISVQKKNSLFGFWTWTLARNVFFTYGAWTSPKPSKNRFFVNLWHGDGPKANPDLNKYNSVNSNVVVSSNKLWGEKKIIAFNSPDSSLLVHNNPRIYFSFLPVSDLELLNLGIDPNSPFVFFLPTWERSRSAKPNEDSHSNFLEALFGELNKSGIQIVYKRHPLEISNDFFFPRGSVDLSNTVFGVSGVPPFYSLIGRSSGLISDYSSVITDFEILNKPVGLIDFNFLDMIQDGLVYQEFQNWRNSFISLRSERDVKEFILKVQANSSEPTKSLTLDQIFAESSLLSELKELGLK